MNKTSFLLRNLLRGFVWLGLLIALFLFFRQYLEDDTKTWLSSIYEQPLLIFFVFFVSEVLIGIIPPEFFMFWALRNEILTDYIGNIFALSLISYSAGVMGYWIGSYLNQSKFYRLMKRNFFGKYEKYLNEFGGFIIIVAALTPLPFSGIAMLMGSVKFPFKKYLHFSLFRFLRFIVYSFIIWEANIL